MKGRLQKKFLVQVFVVAFFSIFIWLYAYAEDTSLPINDKVTGTIIEGKTSFRYKVVIPEDGKFQLVLVPDASLDLDMYLYGQDGTTEIYKVQEGMGKTSSITRNLMPGTYYVEVLRDTWRIDGFGAYTLTSTYTMEPKANDKEDNNSYLNAVPMENNKTVTGHMGFTNADNLTDKSDWYKIVMPEDGNLQLVMVPDPSVVMEMHLYGQDGTSEIKYAHEAMGKTQNIKCVLNAGNYYLSVIRANYVVDGSGPYTLTNTYSSLKKNNKLVLQIGQPKMTFNSQTKEIDPGRGTKPLIVSGRTLVPIKSIIETMKGTVDWSDKDKRVTIKVGGSSIELWLDRKLAVINGTANPIDVAPVSINGRTMVPLRFVTENLNCDVNWEDSSKKIIIQF